MKKWFSNNMLYIIGAVVGAIAGFFLLATNRMCNRHLCHYIEAHKQYIIWRSDGCCILRII